MDFTQLKQFIEIAKYESVTKASESLYITQPALSLSLKKIEAELGFTLFDRFGNKIKITENGKIVLDYALKILNLQEEMVEMLNHNAKPLNIYTPIDSIKLYVIPKYIETNNTLLNQQNLAEHDIKNALLSRTFDVAILPRPLIHQEDFISIPLLKETICISVPNGNPLSKNKQLPLKSFYGQKFMRNTKADSHITYIINKQLHAQNIDLNVIFDGDDVSIYNMLNTTDYLVLLTNLFAKFGFKTKGRKNILITDKEATYTIYVVYLKSQQNRVKQFVDWIVKNYQNIE